jgi:hypothetical protein
MLESDAVLRWSRIHRKPDVPQVCRFYTVSIIEEEKGRKCEFHLLYLSTLNALCVTFMWL